MGQSHEFSVNQLLSVAEALERLLAEFSPVGEEDAPLAQVVGRVSAEAIIASYDLPRFSNSSMDGFAVRAQDVISATQDSPVRLHVIADIAAGVHPNAVLQPGQCARIMTGAVIPDDANAVVPVEYTDFTHRNPGSPAPNSIQVFAAVRQGAYVRRAGEDLRAGETVYQAGTRFRPQDVGFLAMLGIANVRVRRKPKVAIISSGNELLPVDAPLEPGKIYESNSYTLISLVEKQGGMPLKLGIAADREDSIRQKLDLAVEMEADLIISTAGVSVGAFDFVRHVVEQHGSLSFWRVNMRPGKPLAFGNYKGIPFIGLPGNPVSAYVGFEVFVRPALAKLSGMVNFARTRSRVILGESIESDGRESYLRAIVSSVDGKPVAHLTGHQGSGNMRSIVDANALILLPSGVKSLPSGSEVWAWMLD